jgi:hypothetical protein
LPHEIATALYFAAIAKALASHQTRITNMSDQTLQDGLNWAVKQPWITGAFRELFVRALN